LTVGLAAVVCSVSIYMDVQRLDVVERGDAVLVEPGKKQAGCAVVGLAGVAVADRRGEEPQETSRRAFAGGGDCGGDDEIARQRDGGTSLGRDELIHGA
jgi:hypothetical protein